MKDQDKTREQLISELTALRQEVAELQALNVERKEAEALTHTHDELERCVEERTSELTRANELLLENEERFKLFMDHLPGVSFISNPDGIVIYGNKRFLEFYELEPEETLYREFEELTTPDLAAQFREQDRVVLSEGRTLKIEETIPDQSGPRVWLTFKFPLFRRGRPTLIGGVAIDITDRKKAEERLQESEASLAKAQELAHLGSWDWDIDTGVVSCSDETFRIFGYDPKEVEITYELFISWVHPDDKETVQAALRDAFAGVKPYDKEFRIIRSDGAVRLLHSRGDVVAKDHGRPTRMLGAVLDITERRQLEDERDRLFSLSIDMLCVAGFDGSFKQLNPSWEKALGWTQEELLSRPWIDFVHPEDREATESARIDLSADRPVYAFENRYRCKDGSYRWISWNSYPLPEEELIFAVARDVTQQKVAQEAIRESESRYRALFENMGDGVAVYRAENDGEDFIFVDFNRAGEEIDQVSRDQVTGKSVLEMFPAAKEFGLFDVFQRVWRTGEPEGHLVTLYKDERIEGWRDNFVYKLPTGEIVAVYSDETQRVQAEERLKRREQLLATILDASPVGIGQAHDRKLDWGNRAMLDMFGFTEETDYFGKSARILYPSDEEYERVGRALYPDLASGKTAQAEAKFQRKDGSIFDGGIRSSAPDPSHPMARTVVAISDISERKRAEDRLRESEAQYRNIIENLYDVFYQTDRDGRIVLVSPSVERVFGYAPEEVLGVRMSHFYVDPSQRDQFSEVITKSGFVDGFEAALKTKDSREIWVSTNARLRRDQDGNVVGVEGTTRDITERKRAEEALRESEERFRQMAEAMEDVFWMADWDTRRVMYVNPAYETIWGRSAQKILDDPEEWACGVHPDDRERAVENFLNMKEDDIYDHAYRVVRPDGDVRWVRDRGFPVLNKQGKVYRIVGTVQDITELRDADEKRARLEHQLREAQKMEAVGTLAGGIAHDFNNLLQIVLGHAELLMMDADKKTSGYEELHAIRSAADRGADLVRRILTFSRKVDSKIQPVKLNEEVEQAERLLYRTVPKMIEIQTRLADDLKIVNADRSQIEQVLVNLALNAKDAMPEGGTLVFETENVILDENFCKTHLEVQPGEYVRLTVSDTGHGMEEEVVEHVFEPFFTTKRPDKGTGLGLSMVFGIVKMHSGHITCESEPGKGTTFRIYLPVTESKIGSEEAPKLPTPSGGTETILVVDDEELIAELAKKILSRSGYNVLTACSGREALEVYKRERANISLVILDLIMPEMGGKQCLEELLKIDAQVKALIASGFATDGEAKRFLEAAAKGTVSKPFNTRELLQSIRNVLDGV